METVSSVYFWHGGGEGKQQQLVAIETNTIVFVSEGFPMLMLQQRADRGTQYICYTSDSSSGG